MVPAAGFGVRMTPTWNISDPKVDFIAKPALKETFSDKTLLDMVLDNIVESGTVTRAMVRVGDTLDRIEQEKSELLKAMKRKARDDVLGVISRRRGVLLFHNNPDGADDGTGATILSREAKKLVAAEKDVRQVLFIASDLPTISGKCISELVSAHVASGNDVTLSAVRERDPSGHGRIVRYPLMFLGSKSVPSAHRRQETSVCDELNALMRKGDLTVLRLEDAKIRQGAPWSGYLILQKAELEELRTKGYVEIPHPLRGVIPGDRLRVDSELVARCRVPFDPGQDAQWDHRSGKFLAVIEQSQIGVSSEERDRKKELAIGGFGFPLSTEFLHSIKERNVLCMVVSKNVFQRTIRDLDAPNYGRVVSVEGKQLVIPNRRIRGCRADVLMVQGKKVSKQRALSSFKCVKIGSRDGGHFVLERRGNNEYYLPEVANIVSSSGGRVGVHKLPENSARGLDTRTDLRRLSELLMMSFMDELRSEQVEVSSLRSLRATKGFASRLVGRGCKLKGFVHLSGREKIGPSAEVEDSLIESTRPGRTQVGRGARIVRSIVRDSVIGSGCVVVNSFLDGVRLPAGSRAKGRRITLEGGTRRESEARLPSLTEDNLPSREASDGEIEVLEELFGVTVHPRSSLRISRKAGQTLSALSKVIRSVGGPKRFSSLYADSLRRGAYGEILGDNRFPALGLRLRPNVRMSFHVSLLGTVEAESGALLEDCSVRDSDIGACATVKSSRITACRVESSTATPATIEARDISGQVVEAGRLTEAALFPDCQLHSIAQWIRHLSSPATLQNLASAYGRDPDLAAQKKDRLLAVLKHASGRLGKASKVIIVRIPGRVNLMGRHIDHRGGFVNPIAIPREMLMVARPRDDQLVTVENVDQRYRAFSFHLREIAPKHRISSLDEWRDWTQSELEDRRRGGIGADWSDYCKAAVYLQNYYLRQDGSALRELKGANVVVSGDIPMSVGLSSSSAIVLGTYMVLSTLNGLSMTEERFVQLCGEGEWYVGTRGGCGDHAAMMWGRLGKVSHIGFFPLSVSWTAMPPGIRLVVCNSLVEAKKTVGARDKFNEKVATSEIAVMLFLQRYPQFSGKLKRLRDLNPRSLGVSLSEFYAMLKSLPLKITRDELRIALSANAEEIKRLFREHAEPPNGYAVRGVALFGVSECERSRIAPEVMLKGSERFGLLMNVSHNGDREVIHFDGGIKRWRVPLDDAYLDSLSQKSLGRVAEGARLHMQSGSYGCGHERTDMLVDIALDVPGVFGAQLVGAGLGGSVAVLTREDSVGKLLSSLAERFYGSMENVVKNTVVCTPVEGARVLRFAKGA